MTESTTTAQQRSLLAMFIKDPSLMYRTELRPDHFDAEHLRAIFEVLMELDAEGVALSPEVIYNSTNPKVQKIITMQTSGDGIDWVKAALWQPVVGSNFERLAQSVIDAATHRKFCSTVDTINARVQASPASLDLVEDAMSLMEQAYTERVSGKTSDAGMHVEAPDALIARYEAAYAAHLDRPALSYGSRDFDEFVHGMPYGRFGILVADKKAGKSMLVLNLAIVTAVGKWIHTDDNDWVSLNDHPEPVLILDNEMNRRMDFEPRMLSCLSGVPQDFIRNGAFTQYPEMVSRVRRAQEAMNKGKLFFEKVPPGDVKAVRTMVRMYKAKYGVRRVFYDYIKRPANTENTYIEMGNFARMLNEDVAKALEVALIAAAQARDDGRVAGSIDLIRECDISMHLSRVTNSMRKLRIDHSRFTREMAEDEYFDVPSKLHIARMQIGNLKGGSIDNAA